MLCRILSADMASSKETPGNWKSFGWMFSHFRRKADRHVQTMRPMGFHVWYIFLQREITKTRWWFQFGDCLSNVLKKTTMACGKFEQLQDDLLG